jgi:AcrR family transcriptional regulator
MRIARTAEQRQAVQDGILAAALAIISADGVRALTMRELGCRTGMTAGNLYNFFQDKDEIVLTLQLRGFVALDAALAAALAAAKEPAKQAPAALQAYVTWALANRGLYEIMFAPGLPKFTAYRGTPLEGLANEEHLASMRMAETAGDAIERLVGRLPKKDRSAALAGVWSLLHGVVSLEIAGNLAYAGADARSVVERVWRMLAPLAGAAPAPKRRR